MDNYVIFHLHSMLSNGVTNIDSITGYQDYVDQAKAWGMKAMAFSEHGSVFEYLKKKEAVEKAGMKYIHAMEAYVTETVEEKIRDNYHCVLIAKNYEGFLELNRLSSKAFNRSEVKASGDTTQYYYQPRISFDDLLGTSDNIIISTACLASILNNAPDEMRERFICFLAKNKHRCFLEIQHHNVEEQKEYNKYLLTLSDSINVPLIAGTDTHALNDAHMEGRAILQRSKNVHFDNEDKWDLTMKNRADLEMAYALQGALPKEVYEEAIDNTNVMADMIEEFTLDHDYKYPHLWDDSMGTFRQKIEDGIKWRGVDKYENYQEYLDRIEHEIKAYEHNGAIDFMLLMEDIISWCRSQDIMVGYGRGSVNGSVIAWLLGITEMDSIKYKLNFERFMNIERVSLSDIDTDFPPSRIDDVKQYIFAKHGLYCSDIITFNTIADKGAIKDVARALSLPLSEAQEIADSVDNEQKYAESRKKYPELFKYVDLVKGVVVSIGSHPCGTIVSPETLDDHVGLCTTSTSKYPISQLYMKEIDSLNYVKLDLLKLDTIELIDKTCKLAGIPRITPDNIDVDDVKVWNAIRDDTTQIFQWEGTTGDKYIKKLLADENIKKYQAVNKNVDRMTLLSIGNSAIRPAGASYREDLANGVVRTTGSKPIDDFLSNTFGYLVFQCQIIDFLHLYCGFTMGEADVVRRCVDEDTLVTMFNGNQKRIKDVCVGDRVVSYNENGFSEVCDVNNVFDNGEKECVEISLKHGNSIVCTADHKVLTQDGYKTAGSLRCDDFLMTPSRIDGLNPIKVVGIHPVGIRHVYDIEVDKNHNYIANNLIVHNCFAKKLGTEQCIPVIKDGGYITENSKHYIPGYIETMEKKYGISRDKSEQDIVAFIKVIEDASSYLFSLNHSQPYSLEGYASGWLRTYYPLEFLTVAMNINADNEEKTSALTQYAKKVGITFHSPKFRHSRGDYFCDKNDNAIYKGIESIKFMNETVSAELVRLGKNQYKDFVDLLYDLTDTTINSRQLDILIKIDFFSEFGDINTLLWIVQEFNLLYGKKSIKKDSSFVATIGEDVIRQFSDSETPTHIDEINYIDFFRYREVKDIEEALSDCQKFRYETADDGTRKKIANGISYTKLFKKYEITEEEKKYFATKTVYGRFEGIHTKSLLKYLLRNSKYPPCKIGQKIRYEEELLGYINYKDPKLNKRVIAVTKLNTEWSPKFTAYCLNNGKTCELKIHKKRNPKDKRVKIAFHDLPIHNGDILLAKSFVQEPKRRKNAYGNWENAPDVYEWWLNDY